jgi:hypothetical protein
MISCQWITGVLDSGATCVSIRRLRHWTRTALVSCVVLAVLEVEAQAQSQLTAAGGTSSIVTDRGFLTIDVNQAKVGLHVFHASPQSGAHVQRLCGIDVPRIEDHTEETGDVSAAAQAGKRSIFSQGQFVPGGDASFGIVHVFEHGVEAPTCPRPGTADTLLGLRSLGYDAIFLNVRASLVDRALADRVVASPGEIAFVDHAGGFLGPVVGVNHAFSESAILGAALDVAREWASPGDAQPQTACTLTAEGTLSNGTPAIVEKCQARYVGPLPDDWRSQLRVDYTTKLIKNLTGTGPSLGLYAAAAAVARTTAKTSYALSVGPTVHPPGKPSQILGAALFELADITDANKQNPMFNQRISLRLYAALPL